MYDSLFFFVLRSKYFCLPSTSWNKMSFVLETPLWQQVSVEQSYGSFVVPVIEIKPSSDFHCNYKSLPLRYITKLIYFSLNITVFSNLYLPFVFMWMLNFSPFLTWRSAAYQTNSHSKKTLENLVFCIYCSTSGFHYFHELFCTLCA